MSENSDTPEKKDDKTLPDGTVIHGKVTIGSNKKDVMYIVPNDSPSLTAKEHLCIYQAELNGDDDEIGETDIKVERIDIPDEPLTIKIIRGGYRGTLNETSNNSANQEPTWFRKFIDHCRSSVARFCGN